MRHPIERPCPRCQAIAGQPCQGTRGPRKAFHRQRGSRHSLYPIAEVDRGLTDSPIEHALLTAIVDWVDYHEADFAKVSTQTPFGPYRADIMIAVGERRLVVECDSVTFHSSQESIQHDKRRDRFCALNGIGVMRFTGPEITRDARRCAAEVGVWIRGANELDCPRMGQPEEARARR